MTLSECIFLLEAANWTFAKTMPWVPHYYIVRNNWVDPEQFTEMAWCIYRNGTPMKWRNKAAKPYLDAGVWRYWQMTHQPNTTEVINRELISVSKAVLTGVN